jgi:membrane-bound metal-dependent hydrolase YbcI (DUF457 family)
MPDWVSHVLIGLILCEVFNVKKKSLVVFGALLPDVRYLTLAATSFNFPPATVNYLDWFVVVAHLPVGILFLTLFVASFFPYDYKKTVSLISLGWLSHFLADFTTRHMNGGYSFLFPVTFQKYELDIFWTEEYYVILFSSFMLLLFVKLLKSKMFKPQRNKFA